MSVESRTTYLGFIKGKPKDLPSGEKITLELDVKTGTTKHWFEMRKRELHVRNPNLVILNHTIALTSSPKIVSQPLTKDQINDAEISVARKFAGVVLKRTKYRWTPDPDGDTNAELSLAA